MIGSISLYSIEKIGYTQLVSSQAGKGLNILIDFLAPTSQVFVENTEYGKIFPHFSKEQYLESEKIWNDKNPCHPLDMAKKNIPTIRDIKLSLASVCIYYQNCTLYLYFPPKLMLWDLFMICSWDDTQ